MKRIAVWFMSTLSALVLLFSYRTSLSSSAASIKVASTPRPLTTSGTGGSGDDGTGPSSTTPTASASPSASASATKASATKTVTGDVADTQWGPVQVQLTVTSGRITDVQVPQYPQGNQRDLEINSYALPVLVQETISAQSANISMVSGATVTSEGFIQSLQSALSQA